jgi:glycosyltransferase involved in cell wall biosynthesis
MVLFWLFIVAAVIQCIYALYFFVRIFSLPTVNVLPVVNRQPVSIIICAKNEAANLKKNLPAILSQRYHNEAGKAMYEVIVVNDASIDDTAAVLQGVEQRYDNLWDVVITDDEERGLQGKKYALSKGIAHAGHNWLLLTDADCMPSGDTWLQEMIAPLARGREIVAGYGGYNEGIGLLNAFVRWETLHTFLQYSTYALAGIPYMAVGRNMACTKEILQKAQRDPVWNVLPSGDDDLLVSIAGRAHNTAIVYSDSAVTRSKAKDTWRDWVKQKQRHLSTGKYYKLHVKILLGAYGLSHAALWFAFFVLLCSTQRENIIVIMGLRCLAYWVLWVVTAHKLREKNLIYLFPFFDIGWLIYNFAFFPYITWKNKKHWT